MINRVSGINFKGKVQKSIPKEKITRESMTEDIVMLSTVAQIRILDNLDNLKERLELDSQKEAELGIGFEYHPFSSARVTVVDLNNTYGKGKDAILAKAQTIFDRTMDGRRLKDSKLLANIDEIFVKAYKETRNHILAHELEKAEREGKKYIFDRLG